jgi:hypothetical protein
MNLKSLFITSALVIFAALIARSAEVPSKEVPPKAAVEAFRTRLLAATTRHLDLLLAPDGSVDSLKGKTADGQEALAFYLMFEITSEQKYRRGALSLADRVLKDMRETKFGVLAIKEKEKPDGESFMGGGPPAFGFYTANVAYLLDEEGGRNDDLKYIATVLDQYPWNEGGWWSADIDVKTGESKVPMSKPSPINKTASVAMAAGMVSEYVRGIDAELSARLKHKADKCIYEQIIPAQEVDGFWHYSLSGNDPKNKDILGYFMLTTQVLMELQRTNRSYREPKLTAAVQKAQALALKCIAPMTDPNQGLACPEHATSSTPRHYSLGDEPKRGFQLGLILIGAGTFDEGIKIMDASMQHFPFGDAGQEGARSAEVSAIILSWLR